MILYQSISELLVVRLGVFCIFTFNRLFRTITDKKSLKHCGIFYFFEFLLETKKLKLKLNKSQYRHDI